MGMGEKAENIGGKIYKVRYWIAAVILTCCVAAGLSGSSIGTWSLMLENTYGDSQQDMSGDLLGEYQSIRTDEWAVNTPMAFSQYYNQTGEFPLFSDTIRGTKTDAYIVYGQPVMSWKVIFRPFQIGYLFLEPAQGLSFFWCARMLALFLVTLEFGMYLTKKKKLLSLSYALLISCSPVVAWWFAINGLVEMLVFGQLAVLFFIHWMRVRELWKKLLLVLGIGWCGVAFILVFYPSWQIPLGYVYLCLLIGIILRERKTVTWKSREILLSLLLLLVAMGAVLGCIYVQSRETIEAVLNTAYPGDRFYWGGGAFSKLLGGAAGLFYPFISPGFGTTNVCEEAAFVSLFPLGIILGIMWIIKHKKRDPLLISLITGSFFLAAYCTVQWPRWLLQITMLNMAQPERVTIGVGFLGILLLIYILSVWEGKGKQWMMALIAFVGSVAFVLGNMKCYPILMGPKKELALFVILFTGILCILNVMLKKRYWSFFVFSLSIAILGGLTVNPVHKGVDAIYESDVTKEIKKLTAKDNGEGLWLVESLPSLYHNLPMMVGAPTINSTNVYPDLERWHRIDVSGEYEAMYNRYVHFVIRIVDEDFKGELFKGVATDLMEVSLTVDQLKILNPAHIFTERDIREYNTDEVKFELVKKIDRFYIFDVNWKN